MGVNAGKSNTSGAFNLFVGGNAGQANTSGRENLFFGAGSGYSNTTARFNTFVGLNSGYTNTTGENNVFFGQRAGFYNTSGSFNLFLGAATGYANTTGVYNTFVGNGAGYTNTTGNNNTLLGLNAGFKTTSSDNVSIGSNAGLENTTGTQNTFIGTGAGVSASNPGLQNATAIGYGAQVSQSNSVILGAGANVGIGNTAPGNKLEITQGTTGYSGLRLTNLTSSFVPASAASKFLTVNASGDVYLATYSAGARVGAELWSASGLYLQNNSEGGVIIGSGIDKTPSDYNLFVSKGILTEKVKVAIKNTDDWSDKVFAPTYQLQPLHEVAQFIKENQHLPGIPSAIEVVEKGIDVAKMDAKLLEKIEELTLYSIQLEKANQMQQQQRQQDRQELQAMKQKQAELEQLLRQVLSRK
ncbi:bZIP transcription factor [Spirosoma sp. HMF3257]|uniref:BZIP transcription factor n=2 Tax=Spirosoma telluris TaxID=2183553 RepID=A0A327NZI7_9BACT|nr:bZIP transcription factor [Spirosoma telluris]RAI78298.1 bZIP transcription factor [Spirosoma telluris]